MIIDSHELLTQHSLHFHACQLGVIAMLKQGLVVVRRDARVVELSMHCDFEVQSWLHLQ
jgi:hypothetical protein